MKLDEKKWKPAQEAEIRTSIRYYKGKFPVIKKAFQDIPRPLIASLHSEYLDLNYLIFNLEADLNIAEFNLEFGLAHPELPEYDYQDLVSDIKKIDTLMRQIEETELGKVIIAEETGYTESIELAKELRSKFKEMKKNE